MCEREATWFIMLKPEAERYNYKWLIRLTDIEQRSFELSTKGQSRSLFWKKPRALNEIPRSPVFTEHLPCAECSFFCKLPERIKRFFDKRAPLWVLFGVLVYESYTAPGYFRRQPNEKFEPTYLSDIFARHRSRDFLHLSNTEKKIKNGGELLEIVVAANTARVFGFEAS